MDYLKGKPIGLMLIIGLVMALAVPALASDYPAKPITLVIPYPAGGSTDVTGRVLATAAKRYFGQPIIVENKGGGGGTVGPNLVISKPADGYTIGIMASTTVTISWHMGKMNFNPIEDVNHIMRYTGYLYGFVVRADSPWKTLQDFVKYAKENPGKVTYGTTGVGTGPHLAMEQLSYMAGMQLVHVPYKGGAECNTALLGGHVDSVSDSTSWGPLVDAGKFRLLTVYTAARSARYPQVPTLKELGFDMVFPSPLEIMGPKTLPHPIVQKVLDSFKKALDDPEYQTVLKKYDMATTFLNSEDCEKADRSEAEELKKIVQKLGMYKK
ncbi:MAG: tripartite tricarboxylate transporter substrate binding protein [Thermodesulfobacteriota bacterium]